MVPYLTLSVLNYLIIDVACVLPKVSSIAKLAGFEFVPLLQVLTSIVTYQGHIDGHIWFVYSLFLIFVIAIMIGRRLQKPITLLILALTYLILSRTFTLSVIVNRTLYHLFYFAFGMNIQWIDKYVIKANAKQKFLIVAGFIISGGLYVLYFTGVFKPQFEGCIGPVITELRHYAAALTGTFSIFILSEYLNKKKFLRKELIRLGTYSYDIYLLHEPLIVTGLAGVMLTMHIPYFIIISVTSVVAICLCLIISKFIIRKILILKRCMLGQK